MTPDNGADIAIPPALAAQIQAAADEEHRPAIDLLSDAVARYLAARNRREVLLTENLSDEDVAAILRGSMDRQFDHLNAELD